MQKTQLLSGAVSLKHQWRWPVNSVAEETVLPMEEAVDRSKESRGIEEVAAVKDVQGTGMEGGFVMCERMGEVGEERQPVRVKAPVWKRRAVIRVESAETQDTVSGQQGVEDFGAEETSELSFVPSAVSEPQWDLQMCGNKCAEKRASSSSMLRPL